MAKSLYSALFDWIVFRINHALLNTKDLEECAKVRPVTSPAHTPPLPPPSSLSHSHTPPLTPPPEINEYSAVQWKVQYTVRLGLGGGCGPNSQTRIYQTVVVEATQFTILLQYDLQKHVQMKNSPPSPCTLWPLSRPVGVGAVSLRFSPQTFLFLTPS